MVGCAQLRAGRALPGLRPSPQACDRVPCGQCAGRIPCTPFSCAPLGPLPSSRPPPLAPALQPRCSSTRAWRRWSCAMRASLQTTWRTCCQGCRSGRHCVGMGRAGLHGVGCGGRVRASLPHCPASSCPAVAVQPPVALSEPFPASLPLPYQDAPRDPLQAPHPFPYPPSLLHRRTRRSRTWTCRPTRWATTAWRRWRAQWRICRSSPPSTW